jgi:hypothetical protein
MVESAPGFVVIGSQQGDQLGSQFQLSVLAEATGTDTRVEKFLGHLHRQRWALFRHRRLAGGKP